MIVPPNLENRHPKKKYDYIYIIVYFFNGRFFGRSSPENLKIGLETVISVVIQLSKCL